jgi:hypothetical protein
MFFAVAKIPEFFKKLKKTRILGFSLNVRNTCKKRVLTFRKVAQSNENTKKYEKI